MTSAHVITGVRSLIANTSSPMIFGRARRDERCADQDPALLLEAQKR